MKTYIIGDQELWLFTASAAYHLLGALHMTGSRLNYFALDAKDIPEASKAGYKYGKYATISVSIPEGNEEDFKKLSQIKELEEYEAPKGQGRQWKEQSLGEV